MYCTTRNPWTRLTLSVFISKVIPVTIGRQYRSLIRRNTNKICTSRCSIGLGVFSHRYMQINKVNVNLCLMRAFDHRRVIVFSNAEYNGEFNSYLHRSPQDYRLLSLAGLTKHYLVVTVVFSH